MRVRTYSLCRRTITYLSLSPLSFLLFASATTRALVRIVRVFVSRRLAPVPIIAELTIIGTMSIYIILPLEQSANQVGCIHARGIIITRGFRYSFVKRKIGMTMEDGRNWHRFKSKSYYYYLASVLPHVTIINNNIINATQQTTLITTKFRSLYFLLSSSLKIITEINRVYTPPRHI